MSLKQDILRESSKRQIMTFGRKMTNMSILGFHYNLIPYLFFYLINKECSFCEFGK